MSTFSEMWTLISTTLKTNAEAIGVVETSIEDGKYGEKPQRAPFIWVYLEPTKTTVSEAGRVAARQANCMIMCGAKMGTNPREAIVKSLTIAQKCEEAIETVKGTYFGERSITFDSIVADKAITILEFTVRYNRG